MMFISARAFLWVGFVFCILPFAPVADEVNAGDEPTQVTAPPAPQVSPETPVDNPDTSPESVEETPPNLSGNSEDSKVAPDLSELEAKSAAIRDNLKEAVGLADQLTLTLNAVREMQDNLAPVTDTFSVSASTPVADNVHVIIMADTRPISGRQANPIAKGASVNAEIMKSLLEKQCFDTTSKPAINHLEKSGVRVLRDGDFSFQKLQQELNAASVGSNDVLFVYIACHGLTFAEGSHGFQMPTQNTGREILRRSTVWDLMKTKKARQTILISDCCANQQPVSEAVAAPSALIGLATNALSKLLLFQIGDIDVNGSSRPPADPGDGKRGGQFGIYRETGGFFTVAFYGAATGTPLPVSWKKLFDNCQSKLDDQFKPPVPVNVPGRGTINVSRQNHELIRD